MCRVEEGNRLVLSGCLLLRSIIPIFNVYTFACLEEEKVWYLKKENQKNVTRKSCKKYLGDVGLNVSPFLVVMEMKFTIF